LRQEIFGLGALNLEKLVGFVAKFTLVLKITDFMGYFGFIRSCPTGEG